MASMKTAYFYGGTDIRVVKEEIPAPGAGEVLFKVMSAGGVSMNAPVHGSTICSSD